jgi:hypothetical protein
MVEGISMNSAILKPSLERFTLPESNDDNPSFVFPLLLKTSKMVPASDFIYN